MVLTSSKMTPKKVMVIYTGAIQFSGQTAAAQRIASCLSEVESMKVGTLEFPILNRSEQNILKRYCPFSLRLIKTTLSGAFLALSSSIVIFAHGQSMGSLLRMGPLHSLVLLFKGSGKIISTTNGNEFLSWEMKSLKNRMFGWFMRKSQVVTCTGPNVKQGFIKLGVLEKQVEIVKNPCEIDFIEQLTIKEKFDFSKEEPIRLLHLSLLIESKGFPEFVEAVLSLAKEDQLKIDAVLCGPLFTTAFCTRFPDPESKREWIESKIAEINQSQNVRMRWIEGARGLEKQQLFRDAQCFIFPSSFPVESQPLVLIEAMASGCAIISSTTGEIKSLLSPEQAILNDTLSTSKIADLLKRLAADKEKMFDLASKSRQAADEYSLENYKIHWNELVNKVSRNGK